MPRAATKLSRSPAKTKRSAREFSSAARVASKFRRTVGARLRDARQTCISCAPSPRSPTAGIDQFTLMVMPDSKGQTSYSSLKLPINGSFGARCNELIGVIICLGLSGSVFKRSHPLKGTENTPLIGCNRLDYFNTQKWRRSGGQRAFLGKVFPFKPRGFSFGSNRNLLIMEAL